MYEKSDFSVRGHPGSGAGNSGVFTVRLGMLITPDRIVYRGLLGAPSRRMLGALTVYVAHEAPFEISVAGRPRERAYLAVVPPNTPHEISSVDRLVSDILIEPECVSSARILHLPNLIERKQTNDYLQLHKALQRWLDGGEAMEPTADGVDRFFFGRGLESRKLDERIERAVQMIREHPCESFFAAECAKLTNLSFSRFVHLFKEEIGMTFRAFCAWKRARTILPYVTGPCNLTELALHTGYPDSTHFSHSIRRIFGLRPRDILAGSRKLALQCVTSMDAAPPEFDRRRHTLRNYV
jgi:AraC-like DNA-binding protein